jgi:hypothetical protein
VIYGVAKYPDKPQITTFTFCAFFLEVTELFPIFAADKQSIKTYRYEE